MKCIQYKYKEAQTYVDLSGGCGMARSAITVSKQLSHELVERDEQYEQFIELLYSPRH